MTTSLLGMAVVSAAFLVGCGSGQKATTALHDPVQASPIDTNNASSLFPMDLGDTWTYAVTGTQDGSPTPTGGDLQVKVVKVEQTSDGKVGTLELSYAGVVADRQTYLVNASGIYELTASTKDVPFTPKEIVCPFPLNIGQFFTWTGTGVTPTGDSGTMDMKGSVLPFQAADTSIGRDKTLPIETKTTFKTSKASGVYESTVFLYPKVGIVRYVQDVTLGKHKLRTTLSLKSNSLVNS